MLGATGRDQVTSIVVLYGPRTTALVACDDGVYEFTCGEGNKWFASREKVQIKQVLHSPHSCPISVVVKCAKRDQLAANQKRIKACPLAAAESPCSIRQIDREDRQWPQSSFIKH